MNPEPVVPDTSLLPPSPSEPPGPGAGWSQPPAPAAVTNNSLWHRIAAALVLAAVVAAAAGAGIGWSVARWTIDHNRSAQTSTQPESPLVPDSGSIQTGSGSTAEIAAKVNPAIVDINTVIGSSSAAGTGMIITSSGEVLTNHHVVVGSTSIKVTIAGRSQTYSAHVIGVDPSADIALIQIEGASGLPTVKFGKSAALAVGQTVIALGNALGAGGTPHVTRGTITALDQSITAGEGGNQSEQLSGMIQSDAVIYPGDSGGPLVNTSGQVIGMITAGQPQGFRSSASDIGYAIPADTALSVVNRIRAREQSSELIYTQVGYLGVNVQTLDSNAAAQLGLNVTSGVLVTGVVAGSPADGAGLSRYSVITSIGGTAVDNADALGSAIKSHQPGDQVSLTWVTQDGTHTANATLGGVNP
ncbi:MAG TPA: trypsin-like peptidase domain-containing protein [Patescibacteria group bacterium]|nr:trypsin-like peptidase domain-containing protein [Patescibacteria group bacterium]